MCKCFVVGINEPALSSQQLKILSTCSHIFCTERFHPLIEKLHTEKHPITPLSEAVEKIKNLVARENVALLASGDPLFFGIGKMLLRELPKETLSFIPALSAAQRACALFRVPWDDAKVVSLHGRKSAHLPTLLLTSPKTLAFTDATNSPDSIATQLTRYLESIGDTDLLSRITVLVAEDIGLETENVFQGTLTACQTRQFAKLNIMCLLTPLQQPPSCVLGLTEEKIHHSRGLITKNEVRAATLHHLQLPRTGTLWDIGAGSGSVSIEAARLAPELSVYSVDQKSEEMTNIRNNIIRYQCYNVTPIHGRAPEALEPLPQPDRIFIGGSGGSLRTLIHFCALVLKPEGRIIINGVLPKTIEEAQRFLEENGFFYTVSTLAVRRWDNKGQARTFNPITIIAGQR